MNDRSPFMTKVPQVEETPPEKQFCWLKVREYHILTYLVHYIISSYIYPLYFQH